MNLPLAGTRVIELTHVWSGPLCGQILADLGAEVIRVESRAHLDIHRRGGPYPQGQAGVNRSGTWNAQNRGKRACTLDLRQEEGKALFRELCALSDVLIENFTPGTLTRLGLSFESLRELNPRLLLLSLSGYGQSGPHHHSLAYGPMMDAATGLSAATTYADQIPRAVNGWAADVGGALYGCAAIVRALLEEPRQARHLDISQYEAGVLFLAGPLMQILNPLQAPQPTLVVRTVAPSADAEQWLAVSATSLGEITAFFDLIAGREQSSRLMRSLRNDGMSGCTAAIQQAFENWMLQQTAQQGLAFLKSAGVPAVPVSRIADLLNDPELAARSAWSEVEHAECGPTRSYGPAIRLTSPDGLLAAPVPNTLPAPLLAGDNDFIYRDILGLSAERVSDLAARNII